MGYSKEVLRQAFDELARRRRRAAAVEADRRAEIAAKIPETEAIRQELAKTAMAATRAVTADPASE